MQAVDEEPRRHANGRQAAVSNSSSLGRERNQGVRKCGRLATRVRLNHDPPLVVRLWYEVSFGQGMKLPLGAGDISHTPSLPIISISFH